MDTPVQIDTKRLARVKTLKASSHESFAKGACIMEARRAS